MTISFRNGFMRSG